MIPFTRHFRKGKAIRVKNISVFARDWEKRVTVNGNFGGGNGNIYILNMVVVSRLQDYIHLLALIEQYTLK